MTTARTTLRAALAVTVMASGLTLAPAAEAGNDGHGQHGMHGSGQGMTERGMTPDQRRRMMQAMHGQGAGMMGGSPKGRAAMGQHGMMRGPTMGSGMMGGMGMMGPRMMCGMDVMAPMDPATMRRLGGDKRAKLQEMRRKMRRSQMDAMLDMMKIRDEMHEAMLKKRPDPARIRTLHDRMAKRRGEALEARIEMRNKIRDVMGTDDRG